MSSLQEVRIKNFRSFGGEQRLRLSPQVTILLAPNGTGKTSFFQALELGLTGGILALAEDGLKPAVRDRERVAIVGLTFDGAESSVELPVAGTVRRTGSLAPVLGNLETSDLSFLLRLTHLLDQHSERWLVSRPTKEAGVTLSTLPIGRDAALAQATLRRLTPAVTKRVTAATERLNEAKAAREGWRKALAERDAADVDLDRPLLSLEALADLLSAQLPEGQAPVVARRETLGGALARTSTHQEIMRNTLERRLGSLRSWESQLADCTAAVAAVVQAEGALQGAVQRVAAAESEVMGAEEAVTQSGSLRGKRVAERDALQAQSEVLRRLSEALAGEQAARLAVETANSALNDARTTAELLASRLREWLSLEASHVAAQARSAAATRQVAEIADVRQAVAALRAHREVVVQLHKEVGVAKAAHDAAVTALAGLTGERDRLAALEDAARSALEVLQEAGSAVEAAVGQIWLHLPKSEGVCPVCLEPHGATKLQDQMRKARERTDPALAKAAEELKGLSGLVAEAENEVTRQANVVSGLEKGLSTLRLNLETAEVQERALTSRADPGGRGIAEIEGRLEDDEKKALEEARAAALAIHALDPRPAPDDLAKLRVQVEQAREEDAGRQRAKAAAVAALEVATPLAEALRPEAAGIDNPAGLPGRLAQAEAIVADAVRIDSESGLRLTAARQELNVAASSRSTAESTLGDARRHRDGYHTRWTDLDLEGTPNATTLEAALSAALGRMMELDASAEVVARVREELGRWDLAGAQRDKEAAVDRLRNGVSEEQHTARLDDVVRAREQELADWNRNSEALGDLDSHLKEELSQVRELVGAMVPDWQALLRQVVRDTRFADTQLRYFVSRNTDHAETTVAVHGQQVAARLVASEAQLTELQLTFLLAMARRHAWCPWKGLLLDDPTQHHDLVHAAAVFDVLRDYVVEDGFQLVMATHDVLQARYFLRKLRNDGIHATFVQLIPTSSGVLARAD